MLILCLKTNHYCGKKDRNTENRVSREILDLRKSFACVKSHKRAHLKSQTAFFVHEWHPMDNRAAVPHLQGQFACVCVSVFVWESKACGRSSLQYISMDLCACFDHMALANVLYYRYWATSKHLIKINNVSTEAHYNHISIWQAISLCECVCPWMRDRSPTRGFTWLKDKIRTLKGLSWSCDSALIFCPDHCLTWCINFTKFALSKKRFQHIWHELSSFRCICCWLHLSN